MPVILIHGSDDPLVPEAGGNLNGAQLLSTPETVARRAALAGCKVASAAPLPILVNDGTSVTSATYAGCHGGAQVVYYEVLGGGHTWPGGLQYLPASIIGKASRNLDASATVWRFFAGYRL